MWTLGRGSLTDGARSLVKAGFTGWPVVTFTAIGVAESGGRDKVTGQLYVNAWEHHLVDHDPTAKSFLSIDWGWLGLNDYWQRDILENLLTLPWSQQLLDPNTCAEMAFAITLGRGLTFPDGYFLWNTYERKMHEPFLSEARRAARAIGVNV